MVIVSKFPYKSKHQCPSSRTDPDVSVDTVDTVLVPTCPRKVVGSDAPLPCSPGRPSDRLCAPEGISTEWRGPGLGSFLPGHRRRRTPRCPQLLMPQLPLSPTGPSTTEGGSDDETPLSFPITLRVGPPPFFRGRWREGPWEVSLGVRPERSYLRRLLVRPTGRAPCTGHKDRYSRP